MKKQKIIWIALAVVLVVFLALSAKVIDKGTEGQYTGEVAFDASASSFDTRATSRASAIVTPAISESVCASGNTSGIKQSSGQSATRMN